MTTDHIIVFCTCPDQDTAVKLAETLLDKRLAACVNILPALLSVYRWQDKLTRSAEVLLLIKTRASMFDAVQVTIRAAHPYELPEILAVPVSAVTEDYGAWMNANVNDK